MTQKEKDWKQEIVDSLVPRDLRTTQRLMLKAINLTEQELRKGKIIYQLYEKSQKQLSEKEKEIKEISVERDDFAYGMIYYADKLEELIKQVEEIKIKAKQFYDKYVDKYVECDDPDRCVFWQGTIKGLNDVLSLLRAEEQVKK